jgi:hypothetical protein
MPQPASEANIELGPEKRRTISPGFWVPIVLTSDRASCGGLQAADASDRNRERSPGCSVTDKLLCSRRQSPAGKNCYLVLHNVGRRFKEMACRPIHGLRPSYRANSQLRQFKRQGEMMAISSSDKRDIEEALCRLYDALDGNHNAEGFAACFAPSGVFRSRYGEFKGHADIAAFIRSHIANGAEDGARHILSNFIIDEKDDGATIRCYLVKCVNDETRVWIAGTSKIKGHLVQRDGKWLFLSFDLEIALKKPQGPAN